jgi:hypothetical protein
LYFVTGMGSELGAREQQRWTLTMTCPLAEERGLKA